jgi:hypothetical protein
MNSREIKSKRTRKRKCYNDSLEFECRQSPLLHNLRSHDYNLL